MMSIHFYYTLILAPNLPLTSFFSDTKLLIRLQKSNQEVLEQLPHRKSSLPLQHSLSCPCTQLLNPSPCYKLQQHYYFSLPLMLVYKSQCIQQEFLYHGSIFLLQIGYLESCEESTLNIIL